MLTAIFFVQVCPFLPLLAVPEQPRRGGQKRLAGPPFARAIGPAVASAWSLTVRAA